MAYEIKRVEIMASMPFLQTPHDAKVRTLKYDSIVAIIARGKKATSKRARVSVLAVIRSR